MPDDRKERECAELHCGIWNIANDLRGSADDRDFKQYVLGMVFCQYISENLADYTNADERETEKSGFCYAKLDDQEAEQARDDLVKTKGFFILPDNLFFGTTIASCILILKKSKSENSTLFIDASLEFLKVTNSNKLAAVNIEKITSADTERTNKEYFTRLIPNGDIVAPDYNLSVSTYVEQEAKRENILRKDIG
jgi:type I restriction-modification system DNA methylase subunit